MTKPVKVLDFYGNVSDIDASKLRWRPSVYAFVFRGDEILLLKQKNGYDLPGGGVDLGESLEVAVLREVKEETGVTVTNPRLLTVDESFYKRVSAEYDYIHSIMIYYVCDYVEGELSAEGFDEGEQSYAEAPEWVAINTLQDSPIGSSKDFRPLIARAHALSPAQ